MAKLLRLMEAVLGSAAIVCGAQALAADSAPPSEAVSGASSDSSLSQVQDPSQINSSAASISPASRSAPSQSGAPFTRGNDESNAIEQVVVTAQKRREPIQDVPVSISVITAQEAGVVGVTDINDLQITVPGLEFPRLVSGSTPALRGVGSSFGIGGAESEVSVYIDDVYYASGSAVSALAFNNVEQIEVLKGPQGTLFGRNALGGVINITTRSPSDTETADVSIGYANYNTIDGSLYVNEPIAEGLATDFAFNVNNQGGGWGRNLYTGHPVFTDKRFSARNKWLFTPDSVTTITLSGDYSQNRYDDGIAMRPVEGSLFPDGQVYQGFYNVNEIGTPRVSTKQGGVGLKIDRDLDFADLISISSYRHSESLSDDNEGQSDVPTQFITFNDILDSYSEELRLVSKSSGDLTTGDLQWLVGLFYFKDLAKTDLFDSGPSLGGLTLLEPLKQTIASYAVFGQATYALPSAFLLTIGFRETYDVLAKNGTEILLPLVDERSIAHTAEDAFTYRANIEKKFSSDLSIYVGYSTGFKGGIYDFDDITAPAVKPERLDDLEGGLKSEWFDGTLKVNLAVFHYDWNDLQVTSEVRAASGQTATSLVNAASARNTGFEADLELRPFEGLDLTGGVEIMHARFASFPDATISVPLRGGGNTTVSGSAAGFMVPHSPDFSGNVGAKYSTPTDFGLIIGGLNVSYSTKFAWDADNRLKQPSYALLNASVTWMSLSNKWEFKLWGKNITGAKYSIYTTANVVGDEESPAPPATCGVTLTLHV